MIQGIHHITAIASDPQRTVDFYTHVLGLRLVKKSVNQDDTATYHFFFGDRLGEPGMDLTFFTFQPIHQGERGTGLVTTISLAVPQDAFDFWEKRFEAKGVTHEKRVERFETSRIIFYDGDSQRLELVGIPTAKLKQQPAQVWTTAEVSKKEAIHSFYSATLCVTTLSSAQPVLEVFGYTKLRKEGNSTQFKLATQSRAALLEVEEAPSEVMGLNAAGTVHHIAFEVQDEVEQLEMRSRILALGLYPTPVIDRFYFKSVYFRTPAGILFEIATSGPGFTADEEESELGKKLALPPFLEDQREEIEANLVPVTVKD